VPRRGIDTGTAEVAATEPGRDAVGSSGVSSCETDREGGREKKLKRLP